MIVWTIQPPEVLDIIERDGVFRCDTSKSSYANDDQYKEAFDWMVRHMDERGIRHPEGVEYPIWAWYKWDNEHKRPDLREIGYGYKGEILCRIELDVPDDEVLLSHLEAWMCVVRGSYLNPGRNEEEWDENEEILNTSESFEKFSKIIEDSWENIFDMNWDDGGMWGAGEAIQATFWEIRKEMIRKVTKFRSRG